MVALLPDAVAARLAAAPLTYAEVGATADLLPEGYRHVRRTRVLDVPFDLAVERLMTWRVQEAAGLTVASSARRVAEGATVTMRLGPPVLGLRIPCRVVEVVDEPDAAGFAYGTLPGHPESGEERFVVHRDAAGRIGFTVTAFSRPATLLVRAGGPLVRRAQDLMTGRYLRAMEPGGR
ncbi:DUF1990 family protein [Nocardioides sp. DS6]|uniref:DUF1990 family protein n=1 Tax=Nocardioides eburneus TaxID=3231482 RepID=A0ABV3T0Y1_9ACTN